MAEPVSRRPSRSPKIRSPRRNRSRSQKRKTRSRRGEAPPQLIRRLCRAVEDDRVDEGEADEPVLGPFHYGWHQDTAFEANVDLRAGREVGDLIAHHAAFGDVVAGEARWR